MEITGKQIVIKDIQKITDSFQKREVVVETTDGNHSQEILLEFHQDRVDLPDSYEIGENLKFHINIRGKRYEKIGEPTKWFNSIVCWKIERV